MRTDLIATCLFVAMVVPGMAIGADQFTDRGIAKIRADLGPNCPVNLGKVGQVLSGNNGLRQGSHATQDGAISLVKIDVVVM